MGGSFGDSYGGQNQGGSGESRSIRPEDVQIFVTDRDPETKLVVVRAGFSQALAASALDLEVFLVGSDRVELAASFSRVSGLKLIQGLAARVQAPPGLDRASAFVALVFYVPGGFGLRLFSL